MWVVRKGVRCCNIVVPAKAEDVTHRAARDLARIVRHATGATLKIVSEGSAADNGKRIRLRVDPALGRSWRGLPPCGRFRIRCTGEQLEITGVHSRATAYGVYTWLEDALGARWFFPGPLGEDIPKRKSLHVKTGSRRYTPGFAWRSVGGGSIGGWAVKQKLADLPVSGGHAYHKLVPESLFSKHPEYFARIYGKRRQRPSQICHSARGLVQRAIEYVDEQVRAHPDILAMSFCPADFGFFCECTKCRAMDDVTRYYDYYVHESPYGYGGPVFAAHLSERVFAFTARVAERVATKYPGKYLICYAYGAYRFPPSGVRIPDNVIVWLTHTCVGMYNAERRKAEIEMFRKWHKVAKHVVIFEALANQCWPCLPRGVWPLVGEQLKLMKRFGIDGYYTQMWGDFSQNLPAYYLAARLSWDPSRDVEAEIAELYRRGFGPAARHVKRYYKVWEDTWRTNTRDGGMPWARSVIVTKRQYGLCSLVFTPRVMANARGDIEAAKLAAKGSGVYAQRVRFVEAGLRYTELMMDALRECLAIEDMDIPLLYSAPWLKPQYPFDYVKALLMGACDRRVVAHACRRALAAFDRVEAFVRRYEGKYVLSPDIMARSSRDGVTGILKEILRLAKAKRPDRAIERKMFETHEL